MLGSAIARQSVAGGHSSGCSLRGAPTPALPRKRGREQSYIRITAWRSILPVPVLGSSAANLISRGYL